MTQTALHPPAAGGRNDPEDRDDPAIADGTLGLLRARGVPAVPAVAARLETLLGGDADAIVETATALSSGQRRGLRALPDPLPLVPAISRRYAAQRWRPWERAALLLAAVSTDDRVDVLLAVTGRSMPEFLASRISTDLVFVAGHVAFADPRLRIWIHGTAELSERTAVHAALAVHYSSVGEEGHALWHRALQTLAGDTAFASGLSVLAEEALREGDAEHAFAVAREAAAHADRLDRSDARLLAGRAALGMGWLDDAVELLGKVVFGATQEHDLRGVPEYVLAVTLRQGAVPEADLDALRPAEGDRRGWLHWGRAVGYAAILAAQHGARSVSRRWLAAAREADAAAGMDGKLRDAVEAWCTLLLGEREAGEQESAGADDLLRALEQGVAGVTEPAGRLDVCAVRPSSWAEGVLTLDTGTTPLSMAYRGVTAALLRVWEGDVRAAFSILRDASTELPLSIPLGGIGVMLARRLEIAISGRQGELSEALALAQPETAQPPGAMERGMASYLAGRTDEAAAHMKVWAERGMPDPVFAVPGLDELGPLSAPDEAGPPDLHRARRVRTLIRAARENAWGSDYATAAEQSSRIRSPFERGRVEALLGSACVTRGDPAAGIRHLRVARSLLLDAGADAWCRAVEARLIRLGERGESVSAAPTAPIPVVVSADPLGVCRAAWEPVLTERELEVAMRVAEGATNREIAEALTVSVRTVEVHIGRSFTKLDVRSRSELTALAHRTNQYV